MLKIEMLATYLLLVDLFCYIGLYLEAKWVYGT